MAISFAAVSSTAPPFASLGLLTGGGSGCCGRSSFLRVVRSPSSMCFSPLLHTSFLASPSGSLAFRSSFSGLSLGIDLGCGGLVRKKRRALQVRAGKAALCLTKRNRSRKSLARTHGFRRRMRTTTGRAVLKRRRAKGRKVLCTKSYPNRGKRA